MSKGKFSKMLGEFKDFAMKGSVVDLAVGVVIGGAFGSIVSSLVDDIIMPLVGILTGNVDFSNLAISLSENNSIKYGMFLNNIIQFLIISFSLFLVIKQINKLKPAEVQAAPTTKTCPFCKTDIDIEATRCPNCTSELNK